MTKDEIHQRLRDVQLEVLVQTRRYEQHKQAFETACLMCDGVTAQEHRDAAHAAMDGIFDGYASIMALSRQLIYAR